MADFEWLRNLTPADRGILLACRPEFVPAVERMSLPVELPALPVARPPDTQHSHIGSTP